MRRPFQQGDIVDDSYEAKECIGQGGFGFVYRARQLSMDRSVALKVLSPSPAMPDSSAERFRREVLAVRKLTHPNTVRIYEFSETEGGLLYYTMEYLEGETLDQRVDRVGPLPPATVRDILVQTLNSLAEAHGHGIVHRDLKPANVMLVDYSGESNFVKVLDFGIAKAMKGQEGLPDQSLTAAGKIVGTLRYMAPEQAEGDEVGPFTDIYSLSLVAIELLTGRTVLENCSSVELIKTHTSPDPLQLPQVIAGSPLGEALRRGLQKPPDDRYSSADDMRSALESIDDRQLAAEPVVADPGGETVTMQLPDVAGASSSGSRTVDATPPTASPETDPEEGTASATAVTGPPDDVSPENTSSGPFGVIQYSVMALATVGLLAAGWATLLRDSDEGAGRTGHGSAGSTASAAQPTGQKSNRQPQTNTAAKKTDKSSESVELRVENATAHVYADGRDIGPTPVDLELDEPMQLRLEADGYTTKILELRPTDAPERRLELSPSESGGEKATESEGSRARANTEESSRSNGRRERQETPEKNERGDSTDDAQPPGAAGTRSGPTGARAGADDGPSLTGSTGGGAATERTESTSESAGDSEASGEATDWAPIEAEESSESESDPSPESDPHTGSEDSATTEESTDSPEQEQQSDEDVPVF